jgi:antitoxin component YwqK of YwqJK toxin-antitoxin module
MKTRKYIAGVLALLLAISAPAQQTKNQRDAQGRKQGLWEAVDRNGHLVYTGHFKNDRPVGELKRYHPDGGVRVSMQYDENSEKVYSRFFWQNGELAAEGNYINTQRDSVWTFYSYYTKQASYKAAYRNGLRHGKSQNFYPSGSIAEEVLWVDDRKEGVWQQFFESGQVKLSATYQNNLLEGSFMIYFPDGKKETNGKYHNDLPEGTWIRYNQDGAVASTIEYKKGIISNFDELTEKEQDFFRKIEAAKGSIKEPTVEDLIREGGRGR